MAETMNGIKRTSYCGRLSKENIGKEEVVCGWVQKQRDKGHLIFIDLRDRTGVVQLEFDDGTDREVFEKAASVHSEYVLIAKGVIRQREAINTEISTGEIEMYVSELRILSKAQTPPFEITDKITRLQSDFMSPCFVITDIGINVGKAGSSWNIDLIQKSIDFFIIIVIHQIDTIV